MLQQKYRCLAKINAIANDVVRSKPGGPRVLVVRFGGMAINGNRQTIGEHAAAVTPH